MGGLLTVLNVLEERGEITNGNMFLLDPGQQEFFKTISDEELNIKDVIVGGPYGCGKTVVGSEAVKIKDAKLKDMNLDVEKHILTFDVGSMNYDRLNQDLKNKGLKGYNEKDQLKIQ